MSTIRLVRPILGAAELAEVQAVLESGYLTQGPRVAEFEALVARYLGVEHAVATTSATTALHLAMVLLGVGPGDEVIVPSFTFPATVNVILQQGAIPVLADVEPETFNTTPEHVAARLTPRTRAVMVVHLFGLPADMDGISAVTRPRGIPIVEDAACALGARYRGRMCGALGDIACFSFHPRKIVTTGEGGMLTTADSAHGRRARRLRSHGGDRVQNRFVFLEPGFNYRMSDINAAVGIPQMRRLDAIIEERRRLAAGLSARLAGTDGVRLPTEPTDCRHTFQTYAVMLAEGIDRDRVIRRMAEADVETTIGTYALHMEAYMQCCPSCIGVELPGALRVWRQSVALPLYPGLSEPELDRIAAALRRAVAA